MSTFLADVGAIVNGILRDSSGYFGDFDEIWQ